MAITIYETPGCTACRLSKQVLDRAGITYRTVDLSESLDDYRSVKAMGYQQAPVICATFPDGRNDHWSGLRPDKLQTYINAATKDGAAA